MSSAKKTSKPRLRPTLINRTHLELAQYTLNEHRGLLEAAMAPFCKGADITPNAAFRAVTLAIHRVLEEDSRA